MQRDFGKEIDALKKELSEIKDLLMCTFQSKSETKIKTGHIQKMTGMHPNPNIMAIMDSLENISSKEIRQVV